MSAITVPDDGLITGLQRAFALRHAELFLVGGAVRDALLGEADLDLDFATSVPPATTLEILDTLGYGRPYRVGERYGTVGFQVDDRRVEITTYRSETYQPGSRKPNVQFGASLLEDLGRRDFTINSLAWDLDRHELIDPFGGAEDLRRRRLSAVGDPRARSGEDPLRLLRAVRFAARYELTIAAETWDAIVDMADALTTISRERIRDEYERMLTGEDAVRALTLLRDSGLMSASVPELVELTRMADHGPRHPLSLWDHTMRVVALVPPVTVTRWAALLHDVAKPTTRTYEPNGRPRFFHHEEVGAEIARHILSHLRYSNAFVTDVATLVDIHMQLHAYSDEWSDGAVRRLVNRLGPLLKPALDLVRADAAGHTSGEASANGPKFDALESRIERVCARGEYDARSPLSGEDLMARYGRPPGPWIRAIKESLRNEVLEGTLQPDDVRAAWAIADALARRPA